MTETSETDHRGPKAIGIISEALVFARLVELGYGVSLPFGDNQRYDFVVDDGEGLSRAQVKTGRLRSGSIVFSSRSTNWHSREQRGYLGDADDFFVYCPDTNEVYRVAVADCGLSGKVTLRVDPDSRTTAGRPFQRWARDHVFYEPAEPLKPLKSCARLHPDTPSRIRLKPIKGGRPRPVCRECNRVYELNRLQSRRAEAVS